jgi:FkbM family methyltransferase
LIRILKNIIKAISVKFNYSVHIKLNGKKFVIPIVKNIGLKHLSNHEGTWPVPLIGKLLDVRRGTFIDIGSNIGQTLLALRAVSENENYIGFEPNSACVFYIRHLIYKNKLKNCRIICAGVSYENSISEIDITSEADTGGSMIRNFRPNFKYNEILTVPVLSFDNIVQRLNISEISIVKIDVEGAELFVIKGLIMSIKNFRPIIICEVLFAHDNDTIKFVRKRNLELNEILNSLKYRIYQIVKTEKNDDITGLRFCPEFEDKIWTEENKDLCDYLFLPEEMGIDFI